MSRRRLALIFGNDKYYGKHELDSCVNDANDMASSLQKLSFDCTTIHNSSKHKMDCAIRDFCQKIADNDCILIYFSGHGKEEKGQNYLLPIELRHDPKLNCINLDELLKNLNNRGNDLLNIIILDACRADKDNGTWKMKTIDEDECCTPAFGKALTGNVRTPTKSQFALIFSSDPGTVSIAGDSVIHKNSFFTSALLNHLSKPNLRLEDMMAQVTQEVLTKSTMKQRPWLHTCLTEPFYFNKEPQTTASNNSRYSDKTLACEGRACARCGLCRDWRWYPENGRKHYIQRSDATCFCTDYVDYYLEGDYIHGDSYGHHRYIEDDEYDDLDLDDYGMDDYGVYHTGLEKDEYGHLCKCNSNRS